MTVSARDKCEQGLGLIVHLDNLVQLGKEKCLLGRQHRQKAGAYRTMEIAALASPGSHVGNPAHCLGPPHYKEDINTIN